MNLNFCEGLLHKKIAVIVNCGEEATGIKGKSFVTRLQKRFPELEQKNLIHKINDSNLFNEDERTSEIHSSLNFFFTKKIKIIAIAGGDKTIHRTINQAILIWGENQLPAFLILPIAKRNLLSSDIVKAGDSIKFLIKVLAKIKKTRRATYTPRTLLKINSKYGFTFTSGLSIDFLQNEIFLQQSKLPLFFNTLKYFFPLGKANAAFEKYNISFSFEKKKTEMNSLVQIKKNIQSNLILAQTIRYLLPGLKPSFNATDLENEFVLIHSSMSRLSYFLHGFHFLFNWKIKSKKYFHQKLYKAEFIFDNVENYYFDGQKYKARKICIEAGPIIKFIHP